jgi:hypothetical protein
MLTNARRPTLLGEDTEPRRAGARVPTHGREGVDLSLLVGYTIESEQRGRGPIRTGSDRRLSPSWTPWARSGWRQCPRRPPTPMG